MSISDYSPAPCTCQAADTVENRFRGRTPIWTLYSGVLSFRLHSLLDCFHRTQYLKLCSIKEFGLLFLPHILPQPLNSKLHWGRILGCLFFTNSIWDVAGSQPIKCGLGQPGCEEQGFVYDPLKGSIQAILVHV